MHSERPGSYNISRPCSSLCLITLDNSNGAITSLLAQILGNDRRRCIVRSPCWLRTQPFYTYGRANFSQWQESLHMFWQDDRHQMETFSALLDLCAGNWLITGELPSQRLVGRRFDVPFDQSLNKRLSQPSRRRRFDTQSRSLSRHCNGDREQKTSVRVVTHRHWWYNCSSQCTVHLN